MSESNAPVLKREVIKTKTEQDWLEARTRDITSTESAALFGLSPYITPFELWHRKKAGQVVQMEPSERMKWGTRLQDSIAEGIAEDQKWKVARRSTYERLPEFRIGASFDFTILGMPEGEGLLEIKNVDPMTIRDDWIVEGDELEAPPHIEMQVQHQLLVTGLPFAFIGALVGGNRTVLIRREPAPTVINAMLTKIQDFWKTIEANEAPRPNFSKDAAFVTKLNQAVKSGTVLDVAGNEEIEMLAAQYAQCRRVITEHEAERDEIKARLLEKIGDAEKVKGRNFTINAGAVKSSKVEAHERPGYRGFRLNFHESK
jgi:putative phage-type endonuclease